MSEQAKSILTRMHEYINSAAFKGNDEDRFAGNSAINHILERGIDRLSGLSEDQILSHVANTSTTVRQKPAYGSLGGQLGMVVGLPSTMIEAGIRIKEKGFKRGLKETGQAYVGSRPYKLGESARLMTDILAPFGIIKTVRVGKGVTSRIADMPRQARISHIGKTKAKFRGEQYQQLYSGRVGGSSVSRKPDSLAAAFNRMVNAPAQWPIIKKQARKIINSISPVGKGIYTGLSRSIRKDIDKIVSGKGSLKIKAQRIDKMLFGQFNRGALKQSEVRAFNVYGADKLKHKVSIPLAEEISGASAKSKLSIGKGMKTKPVKKIVDTTPRVKPSAKPTPEQQVGSKAGVIMEKIFNEKIKEFKAKSDIAFKKAHPELKNVPKEI